MKRKIIAGMLLIILNLTLILPLHRVEAYTGELDPENYITLPSMINVSNNIGTGTIRLSSSVSNYSISYQKIDITQSTFNTINQKAQELNDYTESFNKTEKELETSLTELQNKYDELVTSGTATEEEIQTAKANYDNKYKEYKEYCDTSKNEFNTKHSEYLALIPDYTDSWQSTSNTADNVKLDFSNYTGITNFILWVKITNGTNTYYDCTGYSSEIKTEQPTENTGDWTNCSNASFSLTKSGISRSLIEISGITPKEGSNYYLLITPTNDKPNLSDYTYNDNLNLSYDESSKTLKTIDTDEVAKYVELNQNLFASIVEVQKNKSNIISYGNKLERYTEPKYADAFYATFISYNSDQIVTNFTHNAENNRKLQIKVGKITDQEILKKLQKQDSSGFADLMAFAKSNSGIYNETVSADKDSSYSISYSAGSSSNLENNLINLNGLEDDAYYYLYVKTDDENGKYISNDAVTFAQASVFDDSWYLSFYGSSDFNWTEFSDNNVDDTIAPGILPKAGINSILIISSLISVCIGVIAYKKHKKYDF